MEEATQKCPLTEEKPCKCSIQYGGSGSFVEAKLVLEDEGMLSVSVDAEDRAEQQASPCLPDLRVPW